MTLSAPERTAHDARRPLDRLLLRVAMAFAALAVVLGAVVALSGNLLPPGESGHAEAQELDAVFGYWLHWDVGWYGRISKEGYPDREVANYEAGAVNRPGSDGGSGYWIPTPAGSVCWAA